MDEKEAENNVHLEKRKLKTNRASETEEQRKERLRIRLEKIENQKTTRGKVKVVRTRSPCKEPFYKLFMCCPYTVSFLYASFLPSFYICVFVVCWLVCLFVFVCC